MNVECFAVVDDPYLADISELEDKLAAFNIERTGIDDAAYLSIFLRSSAGELYAGLHGHSWGGCAEIKLFWVADAFRGQGYGARLMAAAEAEARRRGCWTIVLATHSFQAPGFYERHGFVRIAEVMDYPSGHSEIFMVKHLKG